MNETPTPPPIPIGFKATAKPNQSRGVWLKKGWAVFNPVKPVHGWSLVEQDCIFHSDVPSLIAVPISEDYEEHWNVEPQPKKVSQESVLQEAERLVNGDRQASYGDAAESFERIADFWHTYLKPKLKGDAHISAKDVASMMILMKVSRSVTSNKRDNWVDVAGYAELGSKLED